MRGCVRVTPVSRIQIARFRSSGNSTRPASAAACAGLLDIRPPHELRRRVPRTADFGNGVGIQEQTPDRQLVAVKQAHFAVGKHEVLWLDENLEMAGSYVEFFRLSRAAARFPTRWLRRQRETTLDRPYRSTEGR